MKNSKLTRTLATLTRPELNEFVRFMDVDFFNRKTTLRTYLKYLAAHVKGQADLPEESRLFRRLFPKEDRPVQATEKAIRDRMDKLTHQLRHQLDSYLSWKTSQNKGLEREFQVLEAYKARSARDVFMDQFRKIDRMLDRDFRLHARYHWYKYRLLQTGHEFRSVFLTAGKAPDIADAIPHLDAHYAQTKLMDSWAMLARNIMLNVEAPQEAIEVALALAARSPFRDEFILRTFRTAVCDLLDSSLTVAKTLAIFRELRENFPAMQFDMAVGIFSLISNCIIILQDFYDARMYEEQFEIMRYGLEKGLLYKGDTISFANFSNLVNIALKIGKVDWAEEFVQSYAQRLLPDVRDATIAISGARLHFYREDYPATLRILNVKQKIASPAQKMISKVIRLQCLYELQAYDLLDYELEAGRKFAERTREIGALYARKFGQFVYILRQLQGMRLRGSGPAEIPELTRTRPAPIQADWLREKLRELVRP